MSNYRTLVRNAKHQHDSSLARCVHWGCSVRDGQAKLVSGIAINSSLTAGGILIFQHLAESSSVASTLPALMHAVEIALGITLRISSDSLFPEDRHSLWHV